MQKHNSLFFWGAVLLLSAVYINHVFDHAMQSSDANTAQHMVSPLPHSKVQDRVADVHEQNYKLQVLKQEIDRLKAQNTALQVKLAHTAPANKPQSAAAAPQDSTRVNIAAASDMAYSTPSSADERAFADGLRSGGHVKIRYVPMP